HGRAMAALPLHPRLAHMLLRGRDKGLGQLAAHLAALLGERDIFRGERARDRDIRSRLEAMARGQGGRLQELATRLSSAARPDGKDSVRAEEPRHCGTRAGRLEARAAFSHEQIATDTGPLVALAFPDRIAERRPGGGGHYRLRNGRGARLDPADPLAGE